MWSLEKKSFLDNLTYSIYDILLTTCYDPKIKKVKKGEWRNWLH